MFRLDEVCFEEPFRFSLAVMRRFAEARRARVVVAESDGVLVGFCVVHVEAAKIGYVVTLDVAPEWRRKGLAGVLMGAVEDQVRAAGCEVMVLHVFTGNEAAIRFYESCGYRRITVCADFYGSGLNGMLYLKRICTLPPGKVSKVSI